MLYLLFGIFNTPVCLVFSVSLHFKYLWCIDNLCIIITEITEVFI